MNPEDREKCEKFFGSAWDIHQSLDSFLALAGLKQQDLARLWQSRTFRRLCRRMCGGMAARREIEVGRAAMEAAAKMTSYIAGSGGAGDFNELSRKTYGDCIKLARANEERGDEIEREKTRPPEEPADAGVSRQLSKPQRIAILRKMLGAAEEADD